MKRLYTFAVLSLFAVSGAALVGCAASAEVGTDKTAGSGTDTGYNKTQQTTRDANGNVIQQKTTETKTSPGY